MHRLEDGTVFYSRTAHIDHKSFQPPMVGDVVKCGQQIARVGNADGYYAGGVITSTSIYR
jgi:hypothetical protein